MCIVVGGFIYGAGHVMFHAGKILRNLENKQKNVLKLFKMFKVSFSLNHIFFKSCTQ